MDCVWNITTPSGTGVRLRFIDFQLEDSFSKIKCYDFLQVTDLKQNLTTPRFCGRQSPFEIKYDTNSIQVRFHSDSSGGTRGFMIKWEADIMTECRCNETGKDNFSFYNKLTSTSNRKTGLAEYQETIILVVTSSLLLCLLTVVIGALFYGKRTDRNVAAQRHMELLQQLQTIQSLQAGSYGFLARSKRQSGMYSCLEELEKGEDKGTEDTEMNLENDFIVEQEGPYQTLTEI